MKDLNLLVFLSQLGLTVALPIGGFVLLSVWLRQQFELGVWVVIVGAVLGIVFAVDGLWYALRTMNRLAGKDIKDEPSVSFNEHQ